MILSTTRALIHGWTPAGDQAIIATRAYDVFTSHTPLVGQYSDASTVTHQTLHSLGPMLYWLLALPARFGSPDTLALTMGLVNTLAIVGVVALARRRGGRALMFAVAIAIALMCRSLAPEVFHDVWNPSAGLFGFMLLIFLCWSLACGEYRLLPLTVLVASFVVQCQLAFLPPSLGLLAVGLVGLVASRRLRWSASGGPAAADRTLSGGPPAAADRGRRGPIWRWALAALVIALICWTPPVVDQLTHHPGNLTVVVRTATATKSTLGATVGWRAVVRAIGVPPWWLIDPRSPWERKTDVRRAPGALAGASCLLMLCALLTIAAVGLRRRRADLFAGALIALVLCAALAAVAASTPTTHLLAATLGYTLWWGSPAGMFVWTILGWSAATMSTQRGRSRLSHRSRLSRLSHRSHRSARSHRSRLRAPAFASAIGIGVVAATGTAVAAGESQDYHLWEYRPLGTMFAGLNRGIPAGRTVLLVGSLGDTTFRFKMAARFALVRRGIRPLSRGASFRLGTWYELGHHRYDCIVYVNDGSASPAPRAVAIARASFATSTGNHAVTVWVSRARCPRNLTL
ncbi:MAG TPA: hypothetical protein VII53_04410 [Solirubrobacteraceae bacterium]